MSQCLQGTSSLTSSLHIVAGKAMPLEDILTTPCDVLIPAAIPGVLDAETAQHVQCRIVVSVIAWYMHTAHAAMLPTTEAK